MKGPAHSTSSGPAHSTSSGQARSTGSGQAGEVSVRNAGISFLAADRVVEAVRDISVEFSPGSFTTLLGPSGCGKSSLLGAIAGFVSLTQGEILVDQRPVHRPDGSRGVVFQHHNLFPWKTVRGNVEFGLKMRGIRKTERRRLVEQMLDRVKLRTFQHSYPGHLSGGMQQRVNLARVLVNRPTVMMLDEPFAALDAQTRLQMQEMLLELWNGLRMTVVFVTHDVDEAVLLSDRVLVMSRRPGRIRADFEVPLTRPRTADQLTSTEFNRLKKYCLELLREESLGGEETSEGEPAAMQEPEFTNR
jgi:NitT/TauT family transport system ATP-binding protein